MHLNWKVFLLFSSFMQVCVMTKSDEDISFSMCESHAESLEFSLRAQHFTELHIRHDLKVNTLQFLIYFFI